MRLVAIKVFGRALFEGRAFHGLWWFSGCTHAGGFYFPLPLQSHPGPLPSLGPRAGRRGLLRPPDSQLGKQGPPGPVLRKCEGSWGWGGAGVGSVFLSGRSADPGAHARRDWWAAGLLRVGRGGSSARKIKRDLFTICPLR